MSTKTRRLHPGETPVEEPEAESRETPLIGYILLGIAGGVGLMWIAMVASGFDEATALLLAAAGAVPLLLIVTVVWAVWLFLWKPRPDA